MGSQVSSITQLTCVALTQQQPLPQMPLQELLGKSLKHGTSPYTKPKTSATTKGVYFNSHSIGPSPRPTNSRATGPDPPSTMQPLAIRSVEREELDSGGAANRAPSLPRLSPFLYSFTSPSKVGAFSSSVDSHEFTSNSNFPNSLFSPFCQYYLVSIYKECQYLPLILHSSSGLRQHYKTPTTSSRLASCLQLLSLSTRSEVLVFTAPGRIDQAAEEFCW